MMPIRLPCTMKTRITWRGVRPRVRRMAMSACLSVTSITCDETRLNAPIAMISDSRIAITVFSILQCAEQVGVVLGPVADTVRALELLRERATHVEGPGSMSCSFRRTPVTPSPIRSRRCRSLRLTTASALVEFRCSRLRTRR